jgi:hypothetical protein
MPLSSTVNKLRKFRQFGFIIFLISGIPEVNSQVAHLSLADQRLNLYDNNLVVDSVIDARNQNGCIGFVLKGIDLTKQTAAYFEKPFCQELMDLCSGSLKNDSNTLHLIIRINKLLLSEYLLNKSTFNIVEANITFITLQDGKYFELFEGFASTDHAGLSKSGSSSYSIAEAISFCFNDFISKYGKGMTDYKPIEESSLAVNSLDHRSFKIEHIEDTVRGIFYTFSDFLNYQAEGTDEFIVDYIPGKRNLPGGYDIRWAKNNTRIENIWGFSDGHQFFTRMNKHYYPLYRNNGHFRILARQEGTSLEELAPSIAASLAVGLIGAAFGVMIVPGISTEKPQAVELQLELNSGLLIPVNFIKYKEMNSRMILYLSRYLQEDAIMEVFVDGDFICKLTRNSYYYLTIPPDKNQIELCLKSINDEFYETISPLPYESGVYICKVKEGHKPEKEEVKSEMRKIILQKIENGEVTEACKIE